MTHGRASSNKTAIRAAAIIAAGALAFGLAGCVPEADPDPLPTPPDVKFEQVDVPDSMLYTDDITSIGGGMLAATDTLPFIFGGALIEPGERGIPTVWVSDDGEDWKGVTVDDDFDGSFSGGLNGTETLTVLGGGIWKDGISRAAIWISEDRSDWEKVELPDDFALQYNISDFAVLGDRVLVVGADVDGDAAGLLIDGDDIDEIELPSPAKGELLKPQHLVGHDDDVVLIAYTSAEGDTGSAVAYVSDDAGVTWDEDAHAVAADDLSDVYGAVWTGDTYIATGTVPGQDGDNPQYVAAAWASADGMSWTPESVPAAPDNYYAGPNATVRLSTPGVNNGIVSSIGGNSNRAESGIYTRSAEGVWEFRGVSSANPASGLSGTSVPDGSDGVIGALGLDGSLRLGTFATGRGWLDTETIASQVKIASISAINDSADGKLLTLRADNFTVAADGRWRNASTITEAAYDGDLSVTNVDLEPAQVEGLLELVRASHGDEEVVLGGNFPPEGGVIVINGYHKTDDGTWTAVTGFPATGATSFSSLSYAGGMWIATGGSRASSIVDDTESATVWTSSDGLSWTNAGTFAAGGSLESEAYAACELPDGTPIAIGYTEIERQEFRPAAWAPNAEGSWSALDLGKLDDDYGWFSECAGGDDGVVASATVSGRDVLLLSDDGEDWDTVFTAARGNSIYSPVAVDGGFVAAGSWAKDEFSRPVVWVSVDGEDWEPLAVPSTRDGSTGYVKASGKDVLVSMSAYTGHPLLVIRDIADVIEQLTDD